MLPDMVGKAIVVLFLVGGEVEWGCGALGEEEVDYGGIVETTMEIGENAVGVGNVELGSEVGLYGKRFICFFVDRGGNALMDFVASHLFAS